MRATTMLKTTIGLLMAGMLATTAQAAAPAAGGPGQIQVAYTVYKRPMFDAMTPTKAALALTGGLAKLVGGAPALDTDIEDPALAISKDLARSFGAARPATVVETPILIKGSNRVDRMIAAAGGARYLIDVQTEGWSYEPYPRDWFHFRVTYQAHFRLIDTVDRSVAAEGWCDETTEEAGDRATRGELLADGAAGLKVRMERLGESCAATLKTDILRLPRMATDSRVAEVSDWTPSALASR